MRVLVGKRAFGPIAVVGLVLGGEVVFAGGAAGLSPRNVRIGMMGNLSASYYADLMTPILNGVRLAVDQYNATGPRVRITVIAYDTKGGEPGDAQVLAEKAIARDKIVGLVGPAFPSETHGAGPLLEKAKVPSISASASPPDLAENGWRYWHRLIGDFDAQGAGLGKLIGADLKAQRVFFANDGSSYGWEVAAAARRSVRKTAPKTLTSSLVNDIGPDGFGNGGAATVAKVKAFRPDVVFLGGAPERAGGLAKRLRVAGVTAKFVVSNISFDPSFAKYAGRKATERTYFGCHCLIDPRGAAGPASKAFATAYKAAYAKPPQMFAAEGYDAATAFIQAVKSGATTGKAINSYLSGMSHPGVTKRIVFRRNGEPAANRTFVYRRRGGTFPFYKYF